MNPSETPRKQKGRGIWRQQGQELKELRRPHSADDKIGSASRSSNSQPDPGAGGDVPHLTSTLSATAKEFYPKGYNPHQMENNYNSQFTEVPQDGGDCSSFQLYQNDSIQIATNHLTEIINHLTLNPGRFDALITPLVETFKIWLSDDSIIYAVVDVIVEQSITEPNFRYTGARLCSFLNDEHLLGEQNAFRSTLLNRCRQEHHRIEGYLYEDPERLHGYILFMAELYMQLEVTKGCGNRIAILGSALAEGLLLLLTNQTSENIKCVCQVLKLTGQQLNLQEPTTMSKVISRLSSLANDSSIERNIHFLIKNVVQLQEIGWGQPSTVTPKSTTQQYNSFSNEPVFYGPDGQIITPEESQFLQENFRQIPDDDYDDYGDDGEYWEPNEEMDEEHKAAFEQFLRMNKNQ